MLVGCLGLVVSTRATAQTLSLTCSYFRLAGGGRDISFNGTCTQQGDIVNAGEFALKISLATRQGQWAKILLNGKVGTRFELDRNTFYYATDDLSEFLETRLITQPPQAPSANLAASYIGKWYVEDPKECRHKPGESAELVTYTADRVVGPEISCRVSRTTPHGAATELDLVCNGEGERGVPRKELVQVVNGRLEVSTGKSKDRYLRCP